MSFPPVKKLGSRWEGAVTAVSADGNLITNIQAAEIENWLSSAKIWFRLNGKKIKAQKGASGFMEIAAARAAVGDPVVVEFLT